MAEYGVIVAGGRRAVRGRRPFVVERARPKNYYLRWPNRRWVLVWTPWSGYRCEAWSVLSKGRTIECGYYTY